MKIHQVIIYVYKKKCSEYHKLMEIMLIQIWEVIII